MHVDIPVAPQQASITPIKLRLSAVLPAGSGPNSARIQQQQQQQMLQGQQQQRQPQQRQGSLSSAPSDATQLSAQLSIQQLSSGLQGIVTEVAEYKSDYEMWLRAVLKSGGTSSTEAGMLPPSSLRCSSRPTNIALWMCG